MNPDDGNRPAADDGGGRPEFDEGTPNSSREADVPAVDLDALSNRLDSFPLRIAVAFGSVVEGTATRFSDVDVGIVFQPAVDRAQRLRLLSEINAAIVTTVEWNDVDLVDLERAPPAIAYDALSSGTLLLGDETEATELEAAFLRRKLDFQPVKREWQEALDARLKEGSYGRA